MQVRTQGARAQSLVAAAVALIVLWHGLSALTWWAFDSGPWAQQPRDVLTEASPTGAVRVYGDHPGADVEAAARETVDKLVDSGGLTKNVVMVALPTGSGWVDPDAVEAIEEWSEGSVATISVRYARTPSAVAFLFRPDLAADSATALLTEVTGRIRDLPQSQRPQLIVHGQSLGVAAGLKAVDAVESAGDSGTLPVAAKLWQGRPGTVPSPAAEDCTVDEVNADDPVAKLELGLLRNPVEAARVLAELPGSASASPGTRHSYGPVLPPVGCI